MNLHGFLRQPFLLTKLKSKIQLNSTIFVVGLKYTLKFFNYLL